MKEPIFCSRIMPPHINDVRIYFSQKGMPYTEAERFYHFYNGKHWRSRSGNYLKSWKNIAYHWIASVVHDQPWLFNKTTR